MSYKRVTQKIIDKLESITGRENVLTKEEDIEPYSHDETPQLKFSPEVVVKVKDTSQVHQLLALCNKEKIPITPRGGGTGVTGGAVPVKGGVVLSFEKMNQIKDIDIENQMVVVQPGVINGNLQRELEKEDLFYPVNPASMDSCTIGGNVAESSSGANAVKYGGTKEYVCGIKAVLPSGELIKAGGKLVKNATDYRLIQLITGSEGTLAAITEIILRTVPLPETRVDLIVPVNKLSTVKNIISKIWQEKIIPASIEYIDELTIKITKDFVQQPPSLPVAHHYLLIGVDGKEERVTKDIEILGQICMDEKVEDVLVAEDRPAREKLWKLRQSIRDALLKFSLTMVEEDIVVPRSKITEFVEKINQVCSEYSLTAGVFGHLGDGNVHLNFLKTSSCQDEWEKKVKKALDKLFKIAISMGGKISGEHGIGLVKKAYLPLVMSPAEIDIIRKTKLTFDPNNILNPGKIFDL